MTALAELVATSDAVASTRARGEKLAALSALLVRLDPGEIEIAVGFLIGRPRQGRVGVGWASAWRIETPPAATSSLVLRDIDDAITRIESTTGSGSAGARQAILAGLFARATAPETDFIRRLFVGELRQGALAGLMTDAIARAAGVPLATMRRAAMLDGDLGRTARVALTEGDAALHAIGLHVLRGVQPMLAASAPDVATALGHTGLASVEWKLDGARVQIHRNGDDVRVFTRNLNDVTARLPELAASMRALPASSFVLDGEIIGLGPAGTDDDIDGDTAEEERPQRFQDTMSSFGRSKRVATSGLQTFFFDALHLDGDDLLEAPLEVRRAALTSVAGLPVVPAIVTADAHEAATFLERAVATGHEGVMVKALDAPYDAGRRGGSWRKVKPVRTLDLVVLAAEWGHGRRRGWLSNLHLGARGADGTFVMVGKTFKGLTDVLLAWQTEALQALAIGEEGITVHVRPELVVEIALDGVQVSRRYPGGVALRFARVRRYRPDKTPAEADTIEAVQGLLA